MDTIKFYWYYLESQFYGFPLIIQITVVLVMTLIVLYLLSLVRIFFIARRQKREYKRQEKMEEKYGDKIKEILYDKSNMTAEQIRSNLGIGEKGLKAWEKVHITNVLLDLINSNNEIEYA